LLDSPHYRVRHWVKRELRSRDPQEVSTALDTWLASLEPDNVRSHLEALWLAEGINAPKLELLEQIIRSDEPLAAAAAVKVLRSWYLSLPTLKGDELLAVSAMHSSQHVRREAVLAASHIGTAAAFRAILPILDQPSGPHLRYATRTSFQSESLRSYWDEDPEITGKVEALKRASKPAPDQRTPEELAFDRQEDLQEIQIGCIPERLLFTKKSFRVKAGKPVKLVLKNPDATQHNLIILDLGTPVEEIGEAANEMAKSPEGQKMHFIPEDSRILHATKLLNPNSRETLRFVAPTKPGSYPFVCTFPGHWILMRGEMIVE
jgi:uncharacterized cupredoxin-like copper-binding protein